MSRFLRHYAPLRQLPERKRSEQENCSSHPSCSDSAATLRHVESLESEVLLKTCVVFEKAIAKNFSIDIISDEKSYRTLLIIDIIGSCGKFLSAKFEYNN